MVIKIIEIMALYGSFKAIYVCMRLDFKQVFINFLATKN